MMHEHTSGKSKLLVVAGLIVFLLIMLKPVSENDQLDLYVYRMGAKLAMEGGSPYHTEELRREAQRDYPPKHANDFALNCGFFLPPQAIAVFGPLAAT